ncbi:Sec-independent protein translocase protein TatA [Gracilariopsis chorda]|uniref:Sec-independent protein translocase protein TatA n=1 Tax=Gracilariopsis chorda TaxID=448386 RepID=A0A2V3J0D9_9FLOR|nr:Sec-independent protein translocase protein TatA [Gracilariopsis chorda]|eukprot:PXF47773.1 Sec-independent protein translocase protein TatA [Gracilariopsis chorda]
MGLFGLGLPELAVIAGVGIFIFGPSKIAELGKDLGGLAGGLKKASSEFREAMQESLDEADREIEQKHTDKTAQAPNTTNESSASTTNVQEKAEA